MDEQKGDADKMSAQKRRNILVGFGGVAIVLALAVIFLSPNFPNRSEDASGAIGAVRKHRAPQIAQSDVVLGDEAFKQEQKVRYADFLSDAAALQNIGAMLASEAQSVEARAQLAAQNLEQRSADIQARYAIAARNTVGALTQLGLANVDLQNMAARADAFGVQDMQQFAARLANVDEQLAARKKLQDAEQALASFALAARESQSLAASPQLDILRNAVDAENLAARIASNVEYLEAMAKQAQTLEAIDRGLAARQSLNAQMLGRMSADVLAEAQQLESRAALGMESMLASHGQEIEVLGRMSQSVYAARDSLAARKNLDARAVAAARDNLAAIDRELSARKNAVESRVSLAQRAQLDAVNRHFEARSALGTRANLASSMGDAQSLAARADALAARVGLEARKK